MIERVVAARDVFKRDASDLEWICGQVKPAKVIFLRSIAESFKDDVAVSDSVLDP